MKLLLKLNKPASIQPQADRGLNVKRTSGAKIERRGDLSAPGPASWNPASGDFDAVAYVAQEWCEL